MRHCDILVVGAGHAGAQCAIALRQRGFAGSLAIVGEEPELPYERPPLSKEYLAGEKSFDQLLIRSHAFWTERQIELWAGQRVVAVNSAAHTVGTADGTQVEYGKLIWAAGGHARRLGCEGGQLDGVHTVRNRADVDAIRHALAGRTKVAVIGGGYIGLEAAAVLAKLGKQVTVFEAQDRLLARVAGLALSRFYEAEHRAHGVDVRLDATIAAILGADGRVCGVRLADGEAVPAELVIVGIGIVPSVEPLLTAGALGGNGVTVDRYCATNLPDVYAIGDCALHSNRYANGALVRLESVQNANDMAVTVAKALTGTPEPYDLAPWFWSNQYDLKLQTVGLSSGYDAEVVRGDPAARHFAVLYLKEGRVVALDAVNAVRDYVQGRALIASGAVIPPTRLADPAISLKAMLD